MRYTITEGDLQMLTILLEPGEKIRAEAGKMIYMSANTKMEAHVFGGLKGAFRRILARESLFLTEFSSIEGTALLAFAGNYPGKIEVIDLNKKGGEFIVQKDAYICGQDTVDIGIALVKRFAAGFFGGEGFILERLMGSGLAFIHAGGELIKIKLQEGQQIKVDPGCFVGCDKTVKYDISYVGNIKAALFGGEGLFLLTLTGPGEVILQSMPVSRLAAVLRGVRSK